MPYDAITLGHNIFGEAGIGGALAAHELTHVRQGDECGLLWLPAYLWEQARHGYGCSRFEEEARRAAGESSKCSSLRGKE